MAIFRKIQSKKSRKRNPGTDRFRNQIPEETDPALKQIFSRTVFYHTDDKPLLLGQDSTSKVTAFVRDERHLTVCALSLCLAGPIKIPQDIFGCGSTKSTDSHALSAHGKRRERL
jgi:hypothetical protein